MMVNQTGITLEFGAVAVDDVAQKEVVVTNHTDKHQKYQVSFLYVVNNIDNVFQVLVDSNSIQPEEDCKITVTFKPSIPGHSYVDYYLIDDSSNNTYRLTVQGTCFGPNVFLNKKKLVFNICVNVCEDRRKVVEIVNSSAVDTTFQWFLPHSGHGFFQVSTGNCGLVRAYESISTTITFTGTISGTFSGEFVCLVQYQEPLFLDVVGILKYLTASSIPVEYVSNKYRKKSAYRHFMENCLDCLTRTPAATVFDRFLDFGSGSAEDVTMNMSHTICVTNHEEDDAYFQWIPGVSSFLKISPASNMLSSRNQSPDFEVAKKKIMLLHTILTFRLDPEQIFVADPIGTTISPKTSKLFNIRFRPKIPNQAFGYLICGYFQVEKYYDDKVRASTIWFRIPCIGNTWNPCLDWPTQWDCQTTIVMPPTVPGRVVFSNFMLSNKLETQMLFKFVAPHGTNFVMMPMCGNLMGRGWQIISVALEPKCPGYYCENWELLINKTEKIRISLQGNAEVSHIQVMSQGYNPSTHAMLVFPATITNCTNYVVSHLHNMTRISIHLRVLNTVPWLGGDNCGSIILHPNEIVPYHWWFFPKVPNKVYETTVTCSCVCLIDDKAVGEPTEIFINISGFSEYPKLKVLPKTLNLHDVVVGETASFDLTLYNFGSCSLNFILLFELTGMDDDHTTDIVEFTPKINNLDPSQHCEVKGVAIPNGAGPRKISLTFSVLYHTEFRQIVPLEPEAKSICSIWYDGIYPSIKVHRTISVNSPVVLSGHCLWNILNIDELNKAFIDCRPDAPLTVDLFAPDVYVGADCVEIILVLGCVFAVPVPLALRRDKLCDCPMVEVQVGISMYEMRHTCIHRPLVKITPLEGVVLPNSPMLLHIKFAYSLQGTNVMGFVMTLPNERSLNLHVSVTAHRPGVGILTALRRSVGTTDYLAVLDCGRVPINNLDAVLRIVWLYNPTNVFSTWRLLRGTNNPNAALHCILYFAEVPPQGRLAIPVAFLPTEMIDYQEEFCCSFGFETVKILVKGQGSLPNCLETRLDIPSYIKNIVRAQHRSNVVWLSHEHLTIPLMATHSLSRELIALTNDTDHVIRFIWLPERIPNIINICMTPSWGIIQPKTTQWITMTVYSLQEPATFTISVICELFDLTDRREYQRNELLRRNKTERCAQEFIITEDGVSYPGINDAPPYVLDIPKPVPFYLALSVAVCTQGQRDGCRRMYLKQMFEQTPPYDLLSSEYCVDDMACGERVRCASISMPDVIRIIDGILWDALHSKMMKFQLQFYSKEEIPTYSQLVGTLESGDMTQLSKRITSGICDAIVNKAVFDVHSLNPKHEVEILGI